MFDFDALDDIIATPTVAVAAATAAAPAAAARGSEEENNADDEDDYEDLPDLIDPDAPIEDTEQDVNFVPDEAVSTLDDDAAPEEHICDSCGQISVDGQFGLGDPVAADAEDWFCAACVSSRANSGKPEQQEETSVPPKADAPPSQVLSHKAIEEVADASGRHSQVGVAEQLDTATPSTASAPSDSRDARTAAVGECFETIGKVLMRQGEVLGSPLLGCLPVGTIMEVLELSSKNSRRIRVIEEHGVEGWVSLAKETGEQLLQRREADVEDRIALAQAKIDAKKEAETKSKTGALAKGNSSSSTCDKCDGPHPTDKCPFFKKAREDHKDAWANYGAQKSLKLGGEGGNFILRSGRVVRQPGDGSCLFHSLAYGLTGGRSSYHQAQQLREELAGFIEANPTRKISGDTIEEWVQWDSNISSSQYARRIAHSGWGGGIEMACCSILKNMNVHVYESSRNAGFKRISCFDVPHPKKTIHVLYQGGVHYDALIPH